MFLIKGSDVSNVNGKTEINVNIVVLQNNNNNKLNICK